MNWLENMKDLWKKATPDSYLYHPDFDYRNPIAVKKNSHGTFYVGYNGEENRFMLISPYMSSFYSLTKNNAIMDFNVLMPGYILNDKPNYVLVYGDPKELADKLGSDTVWMMSKDIKPHPSDRPVDWYYAEVRHSKLPYNKLMQAIESNWQKNNVKFTHPMPDYMNPAVYEEIQDAVIGGHTGHERPDYTYPKSTTY